MKQRILVIEDETDIAGILEYLLIDEGYEVTVADTGEKGLAALEGGIYHLVVLDLNLPFMDGLTVCNRIKQTNSVPVIILSARDRDSDVISGLEIGAEDYMTKPFNHREFILRVGKILSRMDEMIARKEIIISDLIINLEREDVSLHGQRINLTPIEYSLLSCLASRTGWVISWQVLLKEVWGHNDDWEGGREMVKVTIQRLRKKIEPDPHHPVYILNEWGKGYRLGAVE